MFCLAHFFQTIFHFASVSEEKGKEEDGSMRRLLTCWLLLVRVTDDLGGREAGGKGLVRPQVAGQNLVHVDHHGERVAGPHNQRQQMRLLVAEEQVAHVRHLHGSNLAKP